MDPEGRRQSLSDSMIGTDCEDEDDIEITEIIEAEDLNDSRTIVNGMEKEKELSASFEKAMVSLRTTIRALLKMNKEGEIEVKNPETGTTLRAKLEEIMMTFNEVNSKRKKIKKVRDAKDKAVIRKMDKLKKCEEKIEEYKKKVDSEEERKREIQEKHTKNISTQTAALDGEETMDRIKKRKERTPEDREQARRKIIR